MLDRNTLIDVTNRSNVTVIFKIPERHIRREFYPKETKRIPYQDILDVVAQPGGRELLYNYLLINNPTALREGLNVDEEPEYWLTEAKIPEWMTTCDLTEFKDALDYAPEGVLGLIKNYAVSLPLNDMAKREAIFNQLKFDVTNAIKNNADSKTEDTSVTGTSSQRRARNVSFDVPTNEPEVKEEEETAPASKYKVVSKQQ